ncbi:putative NRPS-like protein biosynthetic cluster [Lithohypha guttulata]|uniref:putative NRPS-like protein biosynthetic cluster n=1 Tax=Lithohypha guttulata TaxID=1690604 RepID=UPI00315DDE4B
MPQIMLLRGYPAMSSPKTNYFVCTLGEAAQQDVQRPFSDVNHLIDLQASQNSDLPAIGFYRTTKESSQSTLDPQIFTFKEIRNVVSATAALLSQQLQAPDTQTVGILADSSPDFLFAWLGCLWLGHPVLLIAPQCSSSAIAHLCQACNVSILLVDEKHEDLAKAACEIPTENNHLSHTSLPSTPLDIGSEKRSNESQQPARSSQRDDIAYLHHTSGTSSGLPKPIPQTQNGAVGVLPALDGKNQATFTTTPLYHGGPADIFRAWTSSAMIWLFPSQSLPITAKNVVQCLEVAERSAAQGTTPSVKYFTSVPYILQMMAADPEGLKHLQGMDLVGVGGAALPADVGDQLVQQNVNLVSRFGSAEVGFLLSSHREYEKDKEWQYLRQSQKVTQIDFEARDEGLHELIVKADWPHMAKRNHEDGSYSTSDLFARHSSITNGWKYHSRADSQLTLITGKKFDPSPLEDALAASSTLLSNVLVFGNGQPYPGALLFRSNDAKDKSDSDIINEIAPNVERLNTENQSHARIPRSMLIPMPYDESPLEKSSKGTILRNKAVERYASNIEQSYNAVQVDGTQVSDEKVPETILGLIETIVGKEKGADLRLDVDLFSHGVDSVACVQIRHGLRPLVPKETQLPLTVVEDSVTVAGLSETIIKLRHGQAEDTKNDQRHRIVDVVKEFTRLDDSRPVETMTDGFTTVVEPPGKTVLLTGPTGSLGSNVLHQLLRRTDINRLYLLVRGATPQAARERVVKALTSRNLPLPDDFDQKVTILQCKLSDPDLGIPFSDYSTLQSDVDIVLHLAWSVNFLLSLQSFTPHFAAIQNLLNLCLSSTQRRPPRLVFCSSVAAVSNDPSFTTPNTTNVPENLIADIAASSQTGYGLSKLTAELCLARAATSIPSLRNRITILRVGQLSGDTEHGIWSKSEAYPQILATAKITDGTLPDLGSEEKLTWLPVDVAAKAFVEASFVESSMIGGVPTEHVKHKQGEQPEMVAQLTNGANEKAKDTMTIDIDAVKVLHLVNPDAERTFTDFVRKLQTLLQSNNTEKDTKSSQIRLVPAQEWLQKLDQLQQNSEKSTNGAQSLLRLLPFWKQAYAGRKPSSASDPSQSSAKEKEGKAGLFFDVHNSLLAMPTLTYWLGLSTVEARKTQGQAEESSGGSAAAAVVPDGEEDRGYSELLKDDYVLKIWNWVRDNVP